MARRLRHRTIWLSDTHLGSRVCRIDLLLDFLERNTADTLYLVGDIIDLERMRRRFYWPRTHTRALERILEMARTGTRVVYVPGNHDDDFRTFAENYVGPVEVRRQIIHETVSGQRLLVLHGDEFDGTMRCNGLAALVGSAGYGLLLGLNRLAHRVNALLGQPYWSLARAVKMRIGKAAAYVARFRAACLAAAREAGVDGVVCGHIHLPELFEQDGLVYCNDGDWVESCTALVENESGQLGLIRWGRTRTHGATALARPLRDAA